MAEKSEKATPKKLRDARKKGQVAKSKDFPAAFTFIVSLAATFISAKTIYSSLTAYMVSLFRKIPETDQIASQPGAYLSQCMELILTLSLPIMIIVTGVGVLVNFLIIGPIFSMEAMKPDIKKLNPVTNIKNMFKLKTFIELLKSIFKITGALILIYSVVYDSIGEIIGTINLPVIGAMLVFSSFLMKVILRVGIFFIAIAVFDLAFQKRTFAKEMMMEKFEVKQEYKDTEGDPHIKSKRKQRAQEIAYQEGAGAARRAKAIVTNPEHIAVALEYNAEEDPAPKIATMGKGEMAKKIIEIGLDNNIPIMRNIPLAHQLYELGSISNFIPEETYEAVAEILKWLKKLEEKEYNVELFK
ncbi:MAG: type III secretion system export apparatus subunit SctU [Chlamydiales bacterium]|nr:type III secretion system export apparatus subunit SctU [Chlamydiales bacterium]